MDDFSDNDFMRYEEMRDAGATPREVYLAAVQHAMARIKALVVLRKVFSLSLAEAVQVAQLEPAEPLGLRDCFTVMVIDPHTRAPAAPPTESVQPPDVLRTILARRPVIDRPDFISWGHVTRAELEALIQPDFLWIDDDVLQAHPPEQAMWSIFRGQR